jgi:hypothetical protein
VGKVNALQRLAERDITDGLGPLLCHGDGRPITVGYRKLMHALVS